jgi:hypothetical protein
MSEPSTEAEVAAERDFRIVLVLIAIVLLVAAAAARAATRRTGTQEATNATDGG